MASGFGTPSEAASSDWLPSNVGGYSASPGGPDWPPTVSGSYGHAWRQLWPNFWQLVLIGLVAVLVFYVVDVLLGLLTAHAGVLRLVVALYDILVGIPLVYGAAYVVLKAARGQRPEVSDLFAAFKRHYGDSIGAALLTGICTSIATIFFVIPGIIVGIRLSFVPFLVVDEGFGPVAAVKESWRRTRGFSWTIFGIEVLAFFISMAGLIVFVVGIIPAVMWIYLTIASLFIAVTATSAPAGVARQTV